MQSRVKLFRSPVTPVQRVVADDVERGRYGLAFTIAQYQQQILRHGLREALEEIQVQVRCRMMGPVGRVVALHEESPVDSRSFVAAQPAKFNARIADLATLLAVFLAFVMIHAREEII